MNVSKVLYNKSISEVYLNSTITVEFDSFIDIASADNSGLQIYKKPEFQRYSLQYSTTNKLGAADILSGSGIPSNHDAITITPSVPFLPDSEWILIVASGPEGVLPYNSIDGELIKNYSSTFTTLNTLSPSTNNAQSLANQLNIISEVITGPTVKEYITPDISKQGDIQPYIDCPPNFSGSSAANNFEPLGSGIIAPINAGRLILLGSTPGEYSIGISDISTFIFGWDQNVALGPYPDPRVIVTYQEIPVPIDPFASNSLVMDGPIIIAGNEITTAFIPINTLNKEFTVQVKAGRFQNIDGTLLNSTERYVFLGPLSPYLCTVEEAKTGAGMWNIEFTEKDIYYYTKLIHAESVSAVQLAGYTDITQVPLADVPRLSRYVCCTTSLKMRAIGTGGSGGQSGTIGGDVFVKKRDLPGVSITYDVIKAAAASGDKTKTPEQELIKRLLDCIQSTKLLPTAITDPLDKGPIVIKYGVKSAYDRFFPSRGRRV